MSAQDKIRRFNLIIEKVQKSKKPSLKEIKDFLLKQDFPVSLRTLQRDVEQIKYHLNINLEYDSAANGYFIDDNGFAKNVLDLLQQKGFYADLMEFIQENPKHKESILLDNDMQQKGFEHIKDILLAIKQHRKIKFSYKKFNQDKIKEYTISPYEIKEFENRWYITGTYKDDTTLYKFGLERIQSIEVTTKTFQPNKQVIPKEHFAKMIGINDLEKEREIIQLSFSPLLAKYVETLPLHWTQKEIAKENNWVTYEYFVIPNFELEQKILSFGKEVKVLKPTRLKNRIIAIYKHCLNEFY
ncbi:MAG: WYL domain-containing protein [Chitinophagales bacterium]|nr:WYL domain-containing protein [Chitinophagales bacterium]